MTKIKGCAVHPNRHPAFFATLLEMMTAAMIVPALDAAGEQVALPRERRVARFEKSTPGWPYLETRGGHSRAAGRLDRMTGTHPLIREEKP